MTGLSHPLLMGKAPKGRLQPPHSCTPQSSHPPGLTEPRAGVIGMARSVGLQGYIHINPPAPYNKLRSFGLFTREHRAPRGLGDPRLQQMERGRGSRCRRRPQPSLPRAAKLVSGSPGPGCRCWGSWLNAGKEHRVPWGPPGATLPQVTTYRRCRCRGAAGAQRPWRRGWWPPAAPAPAVMSAKRESSRPSPGPRPIPELGPGLAGTPSLPGSCHPLHTCILAPGLCCSGPPTPAPPAELQHWGHPELCTGTWADVQLHSWRRRSGWGQRLPQARGRHSQGSRQKHLLTGSLGGTHRLKHCN